MNSNIRGTVREEPSYMTCDKQYIRAKDAVEKANHEHRCSDMDKGDSRA